MDFGISTSCYYPMLTEDAMASLVEEGVDALELFLNADSECSERALQNFSRILSGGKTRVLSVHPYTSGFESTLLFSDYERRFFDSLEHYKRYFHAAAVLGANYLVLHGERVDRGRLCAEELYFERFARLEEAAESYGVRVAQENVSWCRSGSLDFLVRMKASLGDKAAFVLDLKQAIRSHADYRAILAALGSAVCHIHFSDSSAGQDCLLPGAGTLDFAPFFQELRAIGFDGGVILELYRENYGEVSELFTAYRLLKQEAAKYGVHS